MIVFGVGKLMLLNLQRLVDMPKEKIHICLLMTICFRAYTFQKSGDSKNASWDDKSELCLLKIYGIKTLVKSYLPVKDAHVRPGPGIDGLLEILRNTHSCGEISKDIESSSVGKNN
ncbi:hypothetical protein CerSpe_148580 [Prunus speciosa]